MLILGRASFGYLLRHPWQLCLALLGIAIGVAVVLAVDLANASARKAFNRSIDTLNGQSTHQIVGGPSGVADGLYATLAAQYRDVAFAPVVEGSLELDGRVLSVLGVDPFAERVFRTFTWPPDTASVGAGLGDGGLSELRQFLLNPGAALVSRGTAASFGLEIGRSVSVVVNGRTKTLYVAGILAAAGDQYSGLAIVDIATAQEWLDSPGFLTRIDVRAEADAAATLSAGLPAGVQLLPSAFRNRATEDMTAAFMTNLTAMSLLALLVGVFLIYNSVGFTVVQRRGMLGLMRAVGLTRRQTAGLILAESAALGVVGVLAGTALGIALGERLLALIAQSINDLYFRVSVTDVDVGAVSLAKAAAAGLGTTIVAAMAPALEAARIAPSLSMRRSVIETRAKRVAPRLAAAGCAIAGLAALALTVSGKSLVLGFAALFLIVLGLAIAIPWIVRYAAAGLAYLTAKLGGVTARLSVDGIRASLSRTGVAIVALSVAVSATIGVSVMVDSFRSAVETWLDGTLQSDLYVGVAGGAMDPGLIQILSELPGVAEVSTSRRVWVLGDVEQTRVIALKMASKSYAGTELVTGDASDAWPAFEDSGAVLVSTSYAYRHDVTAGDRVSLLTERGVHKFPIVGVYRSYDANQGAVLMSRRTYNAHWQDRGVDSLGIYLDDGQDTAAAADRVRDASLGRQAVRVASRETLTATSLRIFDRTFIITDVLYWLAVGVAVVGILGSMLALQLERSRELGMLRALGVTPLQLGIHVMGQTAAIGLLSGIAAIPLGLVMAKLLIDVINRRSFGWEMTMQIDPAILASSLALAIAAALCAGAYPAFRAARAIPALAMREE